LPLPVLFWRQAQTAPGFIDLHQHSQTPEAYRFKAMDGVTTALEVEVGAWPVSEWYAAPQGKSLIHFGASSGHIPARMSILHDTGGLLPRDAAMNRPASAPEQRAIATTLFVMPPPSPDPVEPRQDVLQ
jgi:dihydroorotase